MMEIKYKINRWINKWRFELLVLSAALDVTLVIIALKYFGVL